MPATPLFIALSTCGAQRGLKLPTKVDSNDVSIANRCVKNREETADEPIRRERIALAICASSRHSREGVAALRRVTATNLSRILIARHRASVGKEAADERFCRECIASTISRDCKASPPEIVPFCGTMSGGTTQQAPISVAKRRVKNREEAN